jgi:hypothetical protein
MYHLKAKFRRIMEIDNPWIKKQLDLQGKQKGKQKKLTFDQNYSNVEIESNPSSPTKERA